MPDSRFKADDPRLLALPVIERVTVHGESLATVLPAVLQSVADQAVRAQTQALCYGVLRWYGRLAGLLQLLLEHPLKAKDQDIRFLLMLGLYELSDARNPDYAIVSAVVDMAPAIGKPWAKGLLNAVLRRFIRERQDLERRLESDLGAHYSFPQWMIHCLQQDWPQHWPALLDASNRQAPMFLRVDLNAIERNDYLH